MKTAVITGASSEIGISIAKSLETKYNLILIKHQTNIDETIFKTKPVIYNCDFNNSKEINNLLKKLKNTKIDLLINVASFDQNNSINNISVADFEKTLKVNLIAPFELIKNLFNENSNGIVINIASTDGIDTYNEYNIPYATSKSALIHLTKQLNYIYKKLKIYALCPNYVNTNSVKQMEPNFLQSELKRVKQEKLIEVNQISEKINKIITELPQEIIIRME